MSCEEFEKQIVLLTELTSEEQAKVTAHITACDTCAELYRSLAHTNNLVDRAGKVSVKMEDPFRLTNSIMTRIKTEEPKKWSSLDLSFLKFEFPYVKYMMAAFSFLLIVFFGMEQVQSPIIPEASSLRSSKKVVLNRKTFQDNLSKSKAAVSLLLTNSCKNPFNITKVNEDCLKQRMPMHN